MIVAWLRSNPWLHAHCPAVGQDVADLNDALAEACAARDAAERRAHRAEDQLHALEATHSRTLARHQHTVNALRRDLAAQRLDNIIPLQPERR